MAMGNTKTERIGMRIAPEKKDEWLQVSKTWGYNGLTPFIESLVDWAINFDKYGGNYQAYLEAQGKK
jgi:hypothetical protein